MKSASDVASDARWVTLKNALESTKNLGLTAVLWYEKACLAQTPSKSFYSFALSWKGGAGTDMTLK